jgi:hypothetical protein
MSLNRALWTVVATVAVAITSPAALHAQGANDLTGAWRGKVRFTSGAFAGLKDLEYMYAFNAGGTMTESSNYDGLPPVPPAYGAWRKTGPRAYEATYQFFQTKSVSTADSLMKQGGWMPGGYGVITQTITLAADGRTFTSRIHVEMFDNAGKGISGGGSGTASGQRIR